MRIALVVHKFPPASVGGTEVYTLGLARELVRRGHQVSAFYRQDAASADKLSSREEQNGFRAFRTGRRVQGAQGLLARFLDTFFNPGVEEDFQRFLDETEPELVHFQHLMLLSYRLIGLAQRRAVPVLLTLHDYWFLCANSQLIWPDGTLCTGKALGLNCARCTLAPSGIPMWQLARPLAAPLLQIRDALVRRAAIQAGHWMAPSHFLIDRYQRAGFPASGLTYLENGLETDPIHSHAREASADGRVRFTFLGSLAWQKGVHVLVDAFRDVPADRAALRICGDPDVFPKYSASLHSIANSSNTTFIGAIPHHDIWRVLATTDVLVVPSLWYENSPLVVQEAFSAGVPVLASQIGALAEKIEPGINGWLCPPGDVGAWRDAVMHAVDRASPLFGHTPEPLSMKAHVDALLPIYTSLSQSSAVS
jgi:glycosyltransferase involved in cell wall biosynthesis